MQNILAINKPKGITSHDVVNRIRRITGIKRVGHGGTLDPLATGVLVIAIGREYTKQLEKFVKGDKEYIAKIKLGFHSTTDDSEGEKTEIKLEHFPTSKDIEYTLKSFKGDIQQTPPIYSAIKLSGIPAYKKARRRENVALDSRSVTVYDISILSYSYPILEIKVATGPGVYIRSLARDIGEKLGTGGYIEELERTRVTNFTLEDSFTLDEFENKYIHI